METFLKIEEVQENIEEINFNYEKEIELLNQKYGKLKKPHLDSIQELVEGKKENLPKIPSFWLHLLKNSGLFDRLEGGLIEITKEDEEALKFLNQIKIKEEFTETHQTFTLDFIFNENPFFSNEKLTKVFSKKYYKDYKSMIEDTKHVHGENCNHDHEEEEDVEEEIKPTGTKIEWKEGKNLQSKLVTKVLKGNKKKNKTEKKIQKLENCESFFNFFNNFDEDEVNEEHWEILNELRSDVLQDPFYYYMEPNYDDEEEFDEEDEDDDEE